MNGSSTANVVGKKRCPATPWANEVFGIIVTTMLSEKQNPRHHQNIIDLPLQAGIKVLRKKKRNQMTTGRPTSRPCPEGIKDMIGMVITSFCAITV